MTIINKKGDLFTMMDNVDVLVNTVNCYGVMGKGIALEFKDRFPKMFKEYKDLCSEKKIVIGSLYWYEIPNQNKGYDREDLFSKPQQKTSYVLNFPTKMHWRADSKIGYIQAGLQQLVRDIKNKYRNVKTIAMPPLGCGNGGLDWNEVRPLIEKTFNKDLPGILLYLFDPQEESVKKHLYEENFTSQNDKH